MGEVCSREAQQQGIRLAIRVKGGTERNFGTVEALAFAFMVRFLPQPVVKSEKYDHNSDRKSKTSRSDPINPKV